MGYIVTAPVEADLAPESGLLDQPFDLGCGAQFGRRPEWLNRGTLPAEDHIGFSDRHRALTAPYVFLLERENEVLQDGDWEADQETLRALQQSIWIASGIRVEWDLVFLMKPGDPRDTCKRWDRLARYVRPRKSADPRLTRVHLEQARELAAVIRAMPRRGAFWTAVRMATFALDERHGDIVIVLLWAGLEALFGPDSPGETVHRTSMNVALFLEEGGEEAQVLAKRVKDSYALRSHVAHGRQSGFDRGSKPKEREKALALIEETIVWLREASRRIALDPGLLEIFQSGEKRRLFLDGLPYRGKVPAGPAEPSADKGQRLLVDDGATDLSSEQIGQSEIRLQCPDDLL